MNKSLKQLHRSNSQQNIGDRLWKSIRKLKALSYCLEHHDPELVAEKETLHGLADLIFEEAEELDSIRDALGVRDHRKFVQNKGSNE